MHYIQKTNSIVMAVKPKRKSGQKGQCFASHVHLQFVSNASKKQIHYGIISTMKNDLFLEVFQLIQDNNLKKIQMSQASLKQLNDEVQLLLSNKDFSNPTLKSHLRSAKLSIYSNPNFESETQSYLKQAIRFSELNLLFTLASQNSREYENAINNVKFFYENVLISHAGFQPQYQQMITAIHLLFLLSNNRNQEFYSKLESIPLENLQGSYVSYVLLLNDAIQEGNYRKVFSLKNDNPLPEFFGPFLHSISETVRTEIAKSAQKAYATLSIKAALEVFEFSSLKELKDFATSYQESLEDHSVNWVFKEDSINFEKEANKKVHFNSEDLIKKTLEYSLELEKIA